MIHQTVSLIYINLLQGFGRCSFRTVSSMRTQSSTMFHTFYSIFLGFWHCLCIALTKFVGTYNDIAAVRYWLLLFTFIFFFFFCIFVALLFTFDITLTHIYTHLTTVELNANDGNYFKCAKRQK